MWYYRYEYSVEKNGIMHHGEGATPSKHRTDLGAFRAILRAIEIPETIHSCPVRYAIYRIVDGKDRLVMVSMA